MKEKRERHAVGEESNSKTWKRQIITTTTTTGRNPHAELIGVSRPSSWMNGAYILGGNKHSYTVALRKWLGLPVSRPVTSTSGGRVHVTPTSFPLHPKRRWLPFSFLLFSCFFFFLWKKKKLLLVASLLVTREFTLQSVSSHLPLLLLLFVDLSGCCPTRFCNLSTAIFLETVTSVYQPPNNTSQSIERVKY